MPSLLTLDSVSLVHRRQRVLDSCTWHWQRGENIAVCGANGAGKSALAKLLTGQLRPNKGSVRKTPANATVLWLSFDLHRHRIDRDRKLDDSEFRTDAHDPGTTVRAYLAASTADAASIERVLSRLGIGHLAQRGIRYISTGETRKMLIARALLDHPDALILDEPHAGLDRAAQATMGAILRELFASPVAVMLLCASDHHLPADLTRRYFLSDGALTDSPPPRPAPRTGTAHTLPEPTQFAVAVPDTLIQLRHVDVSFHGKPVLSDISWHLRRGQHCHISGPNGAGKTTLLELLCGGNHSAYGQWVEIFGRRRGSGESVWEIKQLFGIVNTNLQWQYRPRVRCCDVIASGFHDTIGLYRDLSPGQIATVDAWLAFCGLASRRGARFGELSFGEQRLALIARAMVKSPPLLILDEPYIALDADNRHRIGTIIDAIAAGGHTSILFVSHDAEDEPGCINQWLQLVPAAQGFTAVVSTAA